MSHFLEAISISKAYPGESLGALVDVSFTMEAGEIQSFIGESGSGKSTLLRLLAGLLRPDEGKILFQGKALENPEEQLIAGHPEIKMVFQDFDLMPNMTVAENLRYPLLNFDKDYAKQRVADLLALCRIESLAHKKPRELSGGQQQRVALARALADEPELLLMDEPFSQLDPVNKTNLLKEILHILKSEGVGLVLVTHDVRDALMISDKVAFLRQGSILQNTSPEALYHKPLNLEVASFFGPLNVFTPDMFRQIFPDVVVQANWEAIDKVAVRTEHMLVEASEEAAGIEVIVNQVFFRGDRYLIQAIHANGQEITFYANASVPNQKHLKLSFVEKNLLCFLR